MTCECTTTLCADHQQSFKEILNDIPDRLATMHITITKQSVMGGQGGRPKHDDDRPLPVNLGAADANQALRATLVNVTARVRHCLDTHPPAQDRNIVGVCTWLIRQLPAIARHPESVGWYTQLATAYAKTTRAIDLPPERVRAGMCPGCRQTLYTVEGKESVTCYQCDTSHDVATLQGSTLERLSNYQDTAANIVRALNAARIPLTLKKLTYWGDAGHVPTVPDERGRLYRVGDVVDAYAKMPAR